MGIIERYLQNIRSVKRYSERTVCIYEDVLRHFLAVTFGTDDVSDEDIVDSLTVPFLRQYEVNLLDDQKMVPKTVSLHLSVLSGFCRFLVKEGVLQSNPVRLVPKPKVEKRLPDFFRNEALEKYFEETQCYASQEYLDAFCENPDCASAKEIYERRLSRLVVLCLYSMGIRRSELIGLNIGDVDFGRKIVIVVGKGKKMREIPLMPSLCEEILLYLKAVEALMGGMRSLKEPLLVTYSGRRLYPVYVDRAVKSELGGRKGMTARKSPHVLRHTLATELMNGDADLNSIKELLGHSSLATTQVYTHNTFARLKNIYEQAHPRAKNGGKHGD